MLPSDSPSHPCPIYRTPIASNRASCPRCARILNRVRNSLPVALLNTAFLEIGDSTVDNLG